MNDKISKEIKELVLARLEAMPSNIKISIGPYGAFSKEDLKKHVESEDEIGKKVIAVQMSFLRSIKEGSLFDSVPGLKKFTEKDRADSE